MWKILHNYITDLDSHINEGKIKVFVEMSLIYGLPDLLVFLAMYTGLDSRNMVGNISLMLTNMCSEMPWSENIKFIS